MGIAARVLTSDMQFKRGIIREFREVAYHYTLAQRSPCVDVRNAGVDVHFDGHSILSKDLFQKHPCDLACLDISIWHKMSFGPVLTRPAQAEPLLFGCARLHKYVALPRNFGFNPPTQ